MDTQTLVKYIDAPYDLNKEDFNNLEKIVDQYPYCNTLNFLYVKAAHNINFKDLPEIMGRVSASAADRSKLYALIDFTEAVQEEKTQSTSAPKKAASSSLQSIRDRIQKKREKRKSAQGNALLSDGRVWHQKLLDIFFKPRIEKLVANQFLVAGSKEFEAKQKLRIENNAKRSAQEANATDAAPTKEERQKRRAERLAQKRLDREKAEKSGSTQPADDRNKRKEERMKRKMEREARMQKREEKNLENKETKRAERSTKNLEERNKARAKRTAERLKSSERKEEKLKTSEKTEEKPETQTAADKTLQRIQEQKNKNKSKTQTTPTTENKPILEENETETAADKALRRIQAVKQKKETKETSSTPKTPENKTQTTRKKDAVDSIFDKIQAFKTAKEEIADDKPKTEKKSFPEKQEEKKSVNPIEENNEKEKAVEFIVEDLAKSIEDQESIDIQEDTKETLQKNKTDQQDDEKVVFELLSDKTTEKTSPENTSTKEEAKETAKTEPAEVTKDAEETEKDRLFNEAKKILDDLKSVNLIETKEKVVPEPEKNTEAKEKAETNDVFAKIEAFKKKNAQKKTAAPEPENPEKEKERDLIQKFTETQPTIPPAPKNEDLTDEEIKNLSEQSVSKTKPIVTELMANIYINQGKNDEAIEIYEKLILKNPEKRAYFAAKIEEVKEIKSKN